MWKEAIVIAILAKLGFDRRKQESGFPIERRGFCGKVTRKKAQSMLDDAINDLKEALK